MLCKNNEVKKLTYKIIRFNFDKPNRTIKTGLTKQEAMDHCGLESTHNTDESKGPLWFDGWTEE